MSARVRAGSQPPARGGDGRRLRWSESPIPKVATRRVRAGGAPPPPCSELSLPAGDSWGRTGLTSTGATFTWLGEGAGWVAESYSFILGVLFDLVESGPVNIRARLTGSGIGGLGTAWSDWTEFTGPDMGAEEVIPNMGMVESWSGGPVTGIELEWDTVDAFTAACVYIYVLT